MIFSISFNIRKCAILLSITNMFTCKNTFEIVVLNLKDVYSDLLANQMVANSSKFQTVLLDLKSIDNIVLDIGKVSIDMLNSIKLLGITIDSKLKFDQRVAELCQRANKKISTFKKSIKIFERKAVSSVVQLFYVSTYLQSADMDILRKWLVTTLTVLI